jgi:hypothetical protein
MRESWEKFIFQSTENSNSYNRIAVFLLGITLVQYKIHR